jgi:hypothetical protein
MKKKKYGETWKFTLGTGLKVGVMIDEYRGLME